MNQELAKHGAAVAFVDHIVLVMQSANVSDVIACVASHCQEKVKSEQVSLQNSKAFEIQQVTLFFIASQCVMVAFYWVQSVILGQ